MFFQGCTFSIVLTLSSIFTAAVLRNDTAWLQINSSWHKDLFFFLSRCWKLTAHLTEEEGDIFSSLFQTSQFSTPVHPFLFFNHVGPFHFCRCSVLSEVNTF